MSRTAESKRSASVDRVVDEAERLGLDVSVLRLDEGTRTAEDAARACGCGVDQIVKSIVFRVGGGNRHVPFLTAGGARVDAARAAEVAGAALEKADAAGVRAHTGFAIGGVSTLGHLTPIESWIDPSLLAYPVVWAAAGTPNHVFSVEPGRLQAAIEATAADFTEPR